MLRKRLNPAAHGRERRFKRFSCEVQLSQPQMIGVAELGSPQAEGVERLQKFVVTQMGRRKHKRHKPIMADLGLIAGQSCAPPRPRKPATPDR